MLGAGGVGLSAVMIAKALGARVIAVDRDAGALAAAAALGADHVLAADRRGRHPRIGSTRSPAAAATSPSTRSAASRPARTRSCRLRRRGRHVQVGLLPRPTGTPRVPMARVIGWELDLLGSHGMAAADYPRHARPDRAR